MSNAVTRLNAALEGRYRIERQLGEGGMATVYRADDLRHGRKVALKVLPGTPFQRSRPVELFRRVARGRRGSARSQLRVLPDGSFLASQPDTAGTRQLMAVDEIRMILNFSAELERRVPR